jgi:hypothetical protein
MSAISLNRSAAGLLLALVLTLAVVAAPASHGADVAQTHALLS